MNYLGNGSHERGNYIMFPQKYFFKVKCVNSFSFHCIHLVAVICIPENEVEVNPTFDCCSNWLYRDVYDVRRLYI